jgi:hypothetical protein
MTTALPVLPSLEHDCAACSALCCVVLPFDAEQGFGVDKAANTPCQHLQTDFSCGIHTELAAKGFRGCIHYSCYGAGQRVTRLFGEVNWHGNPERAVEIYSVFRRMQKLHELQSLVSTARSRINDGAWQQRLLAEQQRLEGLCAQIELQEFVDMDVVATQTMTVLRQLATEPTIVALRNEQKKG